MKFDIWYKKTYLFSKIERTSPSHFKYIINKLMPSFNNELEVSFQYRLKPDDPDNRLVTAWAK